MSKLPKLLSLLLIVSLVCSSLGFSLTAVYADDQTSSPAVILTKIASSDNATLGDTVNYTYNIINNSADNITSLKLIDDKIGPITLPDDMNLAVGDNVTATGSYTVSISDYDASATELVNVATVTGVSSSSDNVTAIATESIILNAYLASLQVVKVADTESALLNDIITYTYTVTNNGMVEISDIALTDDKIGAIPLISDNVTVSSLGPNKAVTVSATYKVVLGDLIAGSIKNIAMVKGVDPQGVTVTGSSEEVTVSTNIIKALLNKADILKLSGVPGKGIDTAPGLQKPFNPKSQASEHAGKKDKTGNEEHTTNMQGNMNTEQNQEQEMNASNEEDNGENNAQEMNQNKGKNKENKKKKNKDNDQD